jgi:hypothetical protein
MHDFIFTGREEVFRTHWKFVWIIATIARRTWTRWENFFYLFLRIVIFWVFIRKPLAPKPESNCLYFVHNALSKPLLQNATAIFLGFCFNLFLCHGHHEAFWTIRLQKYDRFNVHFTYKIAKTAHCEINWVVKIFNVDVCNPFLKNWVKTFLDWADVYFWKSVRI